MQHTTQLQTLQQHAKHTSCFDTLARQHGPDTMPAKCAVHTCMDHQECWDCLMHAYLDSIGNTAEHGLNIHPRVCSQGCWRALLLQIQQLMLQQGQGYGEEELHLALVVCLLNKPSCLQMPSLVVIHPYAASALQIVVALCAGNQLPVNFMILSFMPMQQQNANKETSHAALSACRRVANCLQKPCEAVTTEPRWHQFRCSINLNVASIQMQHQFECSINLDVASI